MLSKVVPSKRSPVWLRRALAGALLLLAGTAPALGQSKLLQQALEQSELDLRIVQGKPVPLDARPWQVGLVAAQKANDLEALFCGGVLLTPNWVLTAAHCVDNKTKPSQVQVLYATNSLNGTGDRMGLDEIILFPGYQATAKGTPITGDAALLKLNGAIRSMRTASLATAQDLKNAKQVTVSGWGRIQFDGAKSQKLLQVDLDLVSNTDCNAGIRWNGEVRDDMFCASGVGSAACRGDSGGPATIRTPSDEVLLAGIVSWGHRKCDSPEKPNVFQRLPNVTDFIEMTIGVKFGG